MLAPVPGAQAVFNPSPAEGGSDGETIESFSSRAPQSISHRGRAIRPSDYETLAHEATPGVAVARAIAGRDASGRSLPGRLTLLIIPQNEDPRPWPSFGLREQVRKFLEARAPADLAAASQIYITGPDYLPVDVTATLSPADISQAGPVEKRARAALQQFLHPLRGGPDKRGWELGRDLYLSDVAAVLERVEGVDYVKELFLLVDGELQGERIAVADDRIVVAGKIQLKLRTAEA
jgi:predicted phage baseplate assembly protein